MITENGIVTTADTVTAWVKTTRSAACEHCSSKKSCGTVHEQKEHIIQVKNTLNVESGDHVVVGLETSPMMYLTFLLYVFPILMMIIGALIGDNLPADLGINSSFASMIIGFSFFALSFYFIRKKNNSLADKEEYKPFLIRKKKPAIPEGCHLS